MEEMLGEEFKGKEIKSSQRKGNKSLTFQHKCPRNHSKMNPSGLWVGGRDCMVPKATDKVSFYTNVLK